MEQVLLNVEPRKNKTKKFREEGFIPGVIYGGGSGKSDPIKIQEASLKRILSSHGMSAKLLIKSGDEKKFGFIKEIQRTPVTNKIVHVDVQFVSKDQDIKMKIPILFKGEEELRGKQLQLSVNKLEAEVIGKLDLIPEVIHVDVTEKAAGDSITFKDLNLDQSIRTHDKEDEIYASVSNLILEKDIEEEEADTKTE